MRPRAILAGLWLAFSFSVQAQVQGQTQVKLLLAQTQARPGETVIAAVQMKMPPDWHTYWRNPGDSGLATKIRWTVPPGIQAGEIQWPVPARHVTNDLTTFVYYHEVLLLVPLHLSSNMPPGSAELKAAVSWLECKESCVPGAARVAATLGVGSESVRSPEAELIETWQKKIPAPDPALRASIEWENRDPANSSNAFFSIVWHNPPAPGPADFFPYKSQDYSVAPASAPPGAPSGPLKIRETIKFLGTAPVREIAGVLVATNAAGAPGYEVRLPAPAAMAMAMSGISAASGPGTGPSAPSRKPLGVILLFAFLGGLILNIMPCVLPVIALKILGFVNQNRDNPKRVRALGLVYCAGVLVSFLALAGLVISVKQAGGSALWGSQFQNPQFLVFLTVLIVLVSLNLFGLFEINLGSRVLSGADNLAAKEGFAGAFFNGVLATILATPCTAPFLSVALGFALAQGALVIVLVFLTVGAGLAAPYLFLSWNPAWLKFLPKPGVWMEQFKIAMGFPMLATGVWLFSLSTPHLGKGGSFWFGIFLVMVALAAWVFGEFVQRARGPKGAGSIIAVLLLILAYGYVLEKKLAWRHPGEKRGGIDWAPWSQEAVSEAQRGGRPVLVDFTADWCATCLANKNFALEVAPVEKKLKEINAATLIGDYTFQDPRIASELRKYNRPGVPLVLIYSANSNQPPLVLPEVLTRDIVLSALSKARH